VSEGKGGGDGMSLCSGSHNKIPQTGDA
jgi:hypothetical protein